jgi:hypothetical protein
MECLTVSERASLEISSSSEYTGWPCGSARYIGLKGDSIGCGWY